MLLMYEKVLQGLGRVRDSGKEELKMGGCRDRRQNNTTEMDGMKKREDFAKHLGLLEEVCMCYHL